METGGMRLALWLLTLSALMHMLASDIFSPGLRKELCESGYLGVKTELCNHPVMKGTCHLSLYRFYYNKITSLCEPFVFSGCGGNRNNFKSKHVCEYYCIHKQKY
uniref:BPTI/Kunitz inhibitor domain-containing protein n=1 Tax=Cricetulus griseus TaxID=10029 RepID=A0A8C2LSG8_CRIGR